MAASLPPAPVVQSGPLKRALVTISLEIEAPTLQGAHNAVVLLTEYGRIFEQLEAHGARCVQWNGVRAWEPEAKRARARREVE